MNIHKKLLLTLSLTAIVLTTGCETSVRDFEDELSRAALQNPQTAPNIDTPEQNQSQEAPNTGGTITSDENTTVGEIKIDAKNAYRVSLSFSDAYNQKGFYSTEEIGQIYFDITNIYTNSPANVAIIDSITLEAEERNATEGKYFNFITYTGEQGPIYTIPKESIKASDNVAIKINKLSGTTNLVFKAKIKLKDEEVSDYELKIPLVIEKNKSSSMAIVPIGTRFENGLFIDRFVIHVVDSYGNKAKDGTSISTGVINNPKLYSNAFRNTVFNKNDRYTLRDIIKSEDPIYFYDDRGTFDKNNAKFTFPYTIDLLDDPITTDDTLVLLANENQYKPENLGGWDIKDLDFTDNSVSLITTDKTSSIDNVSFAIGNEYRYDECSQTLMNAAASSFEITEVKDGVAYAELRYVPAMVGKSVFIYANAQLENKHIGISRKVTLTGLGLTQYTLTCDYKDTGSYCDIRFKMMLNGIENTPAQNVYLEQPKLAGPQVFGTTTASRTDCNGWTTVTIEGIDENKTASVTVGDFIADELIINKQ